MWRSPPGIAAQVCTNLARLDRPVTVVTGDGVHGYPPGGPYDRIVSTASVLSGQLPYAWVQLTIPDGMILTPWCTSFRNGELTSLVVQPDGTAVGTIVDAVSFMRLRSQRTPLGAARLAELVEHSTSAVESVTTVWPAEVTLDEHGEFTVGLFLTDVQHSVARDDAQPDTYELLLYDVVTESAATVQVTPGYADNGTFPVRQHGPRRLCMGRGRDRPCLVGRAQPPGPNPLRTHHHPRHPNRVARPAREHHWRAAIAIASH